MRSIPDTLSLHRSTRTVYMNAAREAHMISDNLDYICVELAEQGKGTEHGKRCIEWAFHLHALRCFLLRARQANWRLVAVKRFAREFEVGRGNLLKVGDDSAWGDL